MGFVRIGEQCFNTSYLVSISLEMTLIKVTLKNGSVKKLQYPTDRAAKSSFDYVTKILEGR